MLNKKFLSVFFIISFFFLTIAKTSFSQWNIPTPLGSTEVWQALKNDLNGSGKWNQISFADGTTLSSVSGGVSFDGFILLSDGSDAAPALAFISNSDTGLKIAGSQMTFVFDTAPTWAFTASLIRPNTAGRPGIQNTTTSATNPGLLPDSSDTTSGLGGLPSSNYISLISKSIEGIRVTEASSETLTEIKSNGVDTSAILEISNTGGDFQIFRDDASPEGVITGSIGDLTLDTTNGGLYLKISGSASNTGWEQIGGTPSFKSYSLSNPGTADTFYIGGHYIFAAAEAQLVIGGTVIQTFGTAGQAHGAHAFCVAEGAGGTDLVLTVTGVSITDAGARNDSDTEIIVADADTALINDYFETSKKWLGQITYTLTGSAGTFDFNYGFVKYEDFGNRAFTVTDFEMTGEARANETGLNIELLHHEATAFLYHESAFIPNQTALISLATDYNTNNDVASGESFAYKRSGLSTAVAGNSGEGVIVRITTAVNNSINDASLHIGVTLN